MSQTVAMAEGQAGAPRRRTASTHAQAIAAAREIAPRLRARAERTDADRRVPVESMRELVQSGLTSLTVPCEFGGSGLGFTSTVEVATVLGEACGSTAWVFGVTTGHHWITALFDEATQREVFLGENNLTASVFRLRGDVVAEGDGFRLTGGEGRFCSGVDYAQWVLVGCAVPNAAAELESAFLLIPISDVEIVDDWFTAGMRGTGSRTIKIADAFVPARRVIRIADTAAGGAPGASVHRAPFYRLPLGMVQPFSLVGAPLGLAKGAVADYADSLGKRLSGQSSEQVAEQSATFARLSKAAVEIDSACALVFEAARRMEALSDPAAMTPLERARLKLDIAQAAQTCRFAVTSLFAASGGSGIYDSSSLQRIWRDINSATSHVAFGWDAAAASYGRALAGLPPSNFTTGWA